MNLQHMTEAQVESFAQRFYRMFQNASLVPAGVPLNGLHILCNGVKISIDMSRDEFLARLEAAHNSTERRRP